MEFLEVFNFTTPLCRFQKLMKHGKKIKKYFKILISILPEHNQTHDDDIYYSQ